VPRVDDASGIEVVEETTAPILDQSRTLGEHPVPQSQIHRMQDLVFMREIKERRDAVEARGLHTPQECLDAVDGSPIPLDDGLVGEMNPTNPLLPELTHGKKNWPLLRGNHHHPLRLLAHLENDFQLTGQHGYTASKM
jgi:hypothetical protein